MHEWPDDWKEVPSDSCLVLLARRCLLEPDLKAYEGPVKFFLHNVNRRRPQKRVHGPGRNLYAIERAGGARRDRTDDLMLAKHALYQLSYGPNLEDWRKLRRAVGDRHAARRAGRPGQTRTADLTLIRRTL